MKYSLIFLFLLSLFSCGGSSESVTERSCKEAFYKEYGDDVDIIRISISNVRDIKFDNVDDRVQYVTMLVYRNDSSENDTVCYCYTDEMGEFLGFEGYFNNDEDNAVTIDE